MRLVTRANLGGVTCAALLTTIETIEQVVFTTPKDVEDNTVKINPGDFVANLPYHYNASFWFSHHVEGTHMTEAMKQVNGKRGSARSTARLIFEFYNSPRLDRFAELLEETDRIDSADLTVEDVLNPENWVLLGYTLDPFMGLANFHAYANSIVAEIRRGSSIHQILDMSDVKGRVKRYLLDYEDFKSEMFEISRLDENVIISDFRDVDVIPSGNRFLAFALFPEGNVQIVLTRDKERNNVRLRLGKSIFNRTCEINLGQLAEKHGGGGLDGAAGFSLSFQDANTKVSEIINLLKAGS